VGGSNGVGVAVIYWAIFTYALVFAVFAIGKFFHDALLLVRKEVQKTEPAADQGTEHARKI
jgi:hypothetical protein